jgi:universal stress protein A
VLIAIDLDGGADAVISRATSILSDGTAQITVLNVVYTDEAMYGPTLGGSFYNTKNWVINKSESSNIAVSKIQTLLDNAGFPERDLIVDFGRPIDVILDYAKSREIDLIILGSHGRHGIQLLLGSTANAVLHRAQCDVLAVKIRG